MGVLKPIHAATGQEMGYTLDRLPVCKDEIEKQTTFTPMTNFTTN